MWFRLAAAPTQQPARNSYVNSLSSSEPARPAPNGPKSRARGDRRQATRSFARRRKKGPESSALSFCRGVVRCGKGQGPRAKGATDRACQARPRRPVGPARPRRWRHAAAERSATGQQLVTLQLLPSNQTLGPNHLKSAFSRPITAAAWTQELPGLQLFGGRLELHLQPQEQVGGRVDLCNRPGSRTQHGA